MNLILILVVAILLIVWCYILPMFYWRKKGFPYIKPYPFVGNLLAATFHRKSFPDASVDMYNAFPDKKLFGTYYGILPILYVRDLNLINTITVKDFEYFTDHADQIYKHDKVFSTTLFALRGDKWKKMRGILTQTFTLSKTKSMFNSVIQSGDQFKEYYTNKCKSLNNNGALEVDVKNVYAQIANDVIASVSFGIKTDSFKNPDNILYKMGQKCTSFDLWRVFFISYLPSLAKMIKLGVLPSKIYDYFDSLIIDTIKVREKENINRPDMLNTLIQASKENQKIIKQNNGHSTDSIGLVLDDHDFVAQGFMYFVAGYDNIAATLAFATYELAYNQVLQKKLQREIDETIDNCGGKLTYEVLKDMKYIDMIFSETLRKWPPVTNTNRIVTKPYTINCDGQDYKLEPEMIVNIPIYAIQRDAQYYPEPEKFDPERFSEENKKNINPLSYLAFGSGPRSCIAYKFALMEMKLCLIYMFQNFDLGLKHQTKLRCQLGVMSLSAEDGFNVTLTPRKKAQHIA